MPIRIQETTSISEINQQIDSLEKKYVISTEEFLSLDSLDERVPEFDAIEWNFLLLQKKAMDNPNDHCMPQVFSAHCQTVTSTVDSDDVRELIAA